jgi:hypothetical protein
VSVCPQCHIISNHKVQRMNTTHVILNHLESKRITLWVPKTLFPTVYITVYIEVLFF